MAKLTRVTGKVFGSAATATVRGIGQFGSAAAGSPNLTTDVATIQALPAYLNGWGSAVITSRNFPPIEEVTGVLKTISYQICYNLQEGVAEYDINTEYTNTSIVKSVNNGIITFYASLQENNIGNSLTDTDYWKPTVLNLDGKADVDLSNINPTQTAINTIVGWGIPDYSAGISVAGTAFPYTVTKDGAMYIKGVTNSNNLQVLVNGSEVAYGSGWSYGGADNAFSNMFNVSVGDVISLSGTGFNSAIFYPLKGVN